MFQQFEKDGTLNEYECERLKQMEKNSRANSTINEVFELGSNIAFIMAMYVQAGYSVSLPNGWQGYSQVTGYNGCNDSTTNVSTTPEVKATFLALAAAATAILAFNTVWRLGLIIYPLLRYGRLVENPMSKFYAIGAVLISVVDPWNGALLLNTVMIKNDADDRTNASLLLQEIAVDISLIVFESLPLVIIQIYYGWLQGFTQTVSISWTVAIVSSVTHLMSSTTEVINLLRRWPQMVKAQASGAVLTIPKDEMKEERA